MRLKGKPDIEVPGRIETIIPAGRTRLPSAALGYGAGGATQTTAEDPEGRQTSEPFFEIVVVPELSAAHRLRPGQTMILRFESTSRPLIVQFWRALRQLFQRRFQV
jgi:putative peptide zinc metalloprotease protein